MKKYIFFSMSLIIILCTYIIIVPIKNDKLTYNTFSSIPVMNDGRIKPIDTLARNYLIGISGKERLKDLELKVIHIILSVNSSIEINTLQKWVRNSLKIM